MDVRTKEEQSRIATLGGIASGEARRKKKTLKNELLLLLETNEGQERMCSAILKRAQKGDTKAFEVIRDTIGQKPIEKVAIAEVSIDVINDIESLFSNDSDTGSDA